MFCSSLTVLQISKYSFHFKIFSLKYLNMAKTFCRNYTMTVPGFWKLPVLSLVKMLPSIF